MEGVADPDSGFLSCDSQQVAFIHIKCHLPPPLPVLKLPKVILELGGVSETETESADVGLQDGVAGEVILWP